MSHFFRFDLGARRRSDVANLASLMAALFEEHVGEGDINVVTALKKRGGSITMDAEREHDDPRAALKAIQTAIDTNANLIDRIDWYRAAVFSDNKIEAFTQGDYRGWIRDVALRELKEVQA